jgi:hypothetical protein
MVTSLRLLLLISAVLCASGWLWAVSVPVADAGGEWCGEDVVRDWVCPLQGTVYAAGRTLRPELPVPINGRRVATASLSSAKLSFKDSANCTLGESSEIFPGGVYANSLFTQRRGSASCWSTRPSRVRIACGGVDQCSTELRAAGSFLFTSTTPTRAVASMTTVRRQRIRIISCDGFAEVKVETLGGVERASAGGSSLSRVVIEIVIVSKRIEKPWGYVIVQTSKVTSEARVPDLQECENSTVAEMEEAVRP